MRQPLLFGSIVLPLLLASCGSLNKMERYMKLSRENKLGAFVVYKNGDTLRGNKIRVQMNSKDFQDDIWLDGKLVDRSQLVSWQTNKSLVENGNARILKGKKNLYVRTERVSIPSYRDEAGRVAANPYTTTTSLYIKHEDGRMELVTYNSLLAIFKNCPAALKKLKNDPDFRNERETPGRYISKDLGGTIAQLLENSENCL